MNENLTCMADNIRYISTLFLLRKIDRAVCEFSGYGDSGEIDYIDFVAPQSSFSQDSHKDVVVPFWQEHQSWDSEFQTYTVSSEITQVSLGNAVEFIAMYEADKSGVDWYNNDGGRGQLTLSPNNLQFESGYNETRYVDVTDFEANIEDYELLESERRGDA